jgi:hypothetical protein
VRSDSEAWEAASAGLRIGLVFETDVADDPTILCVKEHHQPADPWPLTALSDVL